MVVLYKKEMDIILRKKVCATIIRNGLLMTK